MAKLNELEIGDKFTLVKKWDQWPIETVFIFQGLTYVFVYGSNAFDICPEWVKEYTLIVENMEVNKC